MASVDMKDEKITAAVALRPAPDKTVVHANDGDREQKGVTDAVTASQEEADDSEAFEKIEMPSSAGTNANTSKVAEDTSPVRAEGTNGNGSKNEEDAADVAAGMACEIKDLYQKWDAHHQNFYWYESPTPDANTLPVRGASPLATETAPMAKYAIIMRHLQRKEPLRCKAGIHSLVVQSPLLRRVLQINLRGYPNIALTAPCMVFRPPFAPLVHTWSSLEAACWDKHYDAATRAHVRLLRQCLFPSVRSTFTRIRSFPPGGYISYDFLWAIFKPGCTVLTTRYGQLCAMRLVEGTYTQHERLGPVFELTCERVEHDGVRFGWETVRLPLESFPCSEPIDRLVAYPLDYHKAQPPETIRTLLLDRGGRFKQLAAGWHHRTYTGPALDTASEHGPRSVRVTGRIVVDTRAYARYSSGGDNDDNDNGMPVLRPLEAPRDTPPLMVDYYADCIHDDSEFQNMYGLGGHRKGHCMYPPSPGRQRDRSPAPDPLRAGYDVALFGEGGGQSDSACRSDSFSDFDSDSDSDGASNSDGDSDSDSDAGRRGGKHGGGGRANKDKGEADTLFQLRARKRKLPLSLDGDQFMLCPPTVRGFALDSHAWLEFYVDRVAYIDVDDYAMNCLVLPAGHKDSIDQITCGQDMAHGRWNRTHTCSASFSPCGKKCGLAFLLSGPPGTGKTLTARALAEELRRPIVVLHMDDHGGCTEGEMAFVVSRMGTLASRWRAVLVLDRCDALLGGSSGGGEEDAPSALTKNNPLVSVALRALAAFSGILFLTVNNAAAAVAARLEAACEDRVFLHLAYPPLNTRARYCIWKQLFHRKEGDDSRESYYEGCRRVDRDGDSDGDKGQKDLKLRIR
ncbi:ATPase, AAA-type, core [Niveomyces insectorum RCEF 264]|uniref:ATPase, AAA-type, core n=1 Tax=Niveomyces insectorum RCEF 264 TaxID=1081102 RepID=A0A167S1Y1_9HYPO|nr:ATPase, AAA-type, core [Niveomyces insectorum RCEF 264]